MATKQKKASMKEYREQFKKDLEDKKTKIQHLSKSELQAHLDRVKKVYQSRHVPSLLGDFGWDKVHKYHWHTYDEDRLDDKLTRRLEIGWGFANREDAVKSGLSDGKINLAELDGETIVEMSHKNCKAVLLKIHIDLWRLNAKIREDVEKERLQKDSLGNQVRTSQVEQGSNLIVTHDEDSTMLD